MVYIVVLQAFPGAGKTAIAKYLVHHGFHRLNIEDWAKEKFGAQWFSHALTAGTPFWNEYWNTVLIPQAQKYTQEGTSIVFDTTQGLVRWPEERMRLGSFYKSLAGSKYLIELTVTDQERYRRIAGRNRIPLADARNFDENYDWEQRYLPAQELEVKALSLQNETSADLRAIKTRLNEEFFASR